MGDLTGWHVSVVAALALAGFCAPGWVSFKTICDKFPWESWIVFGSGVSLGAAMLKSGLGQFSQRKRHQTFGDTISNP